MEVLTVFREGRWIDYEPRMTIQVDPRVTKPLKQKAASVYVTACQKGFSEERAHLLAETVVFKSLYKDLEYNKTIESELERLMDRGGTA